MSEISNITSAKNPAKSYVGEIKKSIPSIDMSLNSKYYKFDNVALEFLEIQIQDVFIQKKNKTLKQTIEHKRYKKLHEEARENHDAQLDIPIGEFLYHLKTKSNSFYRKFLNTYGDLTYCTFRITQEDRLTQKGLYIYTVDNKIKYIGRCKDSFKKRINQGYGKIHPKNCYKDGQSTNCHLNALISENIRSVAFYVLPLTDNKEIETTERELIQAYEPTWNIALNRKKLSTK
jgi:hypothetical protein